MYLYKSEMLDLSVKLAADKSPEREDLKKLDNLINTRANEGWELVTYEYISSSRSASCYFLVTFKKEIHKTTV